LFRDGLLEVEAGYAESGRAVATLVQRAESIGVELRSSSRFAHLDEHDHHIEGILLDNGERIAGNRVVMAVGAWTPYLLPFTKKFFRASGQPVFHLKPPRPDHFTPERFPVFGADITATGYYGFPLNRDGVVKIANHGPGREMSPESPQRAVSSEQEEHLREFLSWAFPKLANAPIIHTRVCMYCETHDGDFWIAADPQREGLVIATGDCGHGFKFAPVLGEIIADAVEQKSNPILEKFRWRPEVSSGAATDVARFRGNHDQGDNRSHNH
jgi:glycine/D-amino acid oxidase-like deaminating enzyme